MVGPSERDLSGGPIITLDDYLWNCSHFCFESVEEFDIWASIKRFIGSVLFTLLQKIVLARQVVPRSLCLGTGLGIVNLLD